MNDHRFYCPNCKATVAICAGEHAQEYEWSQSYVEYVRQGFLHEVGDFRGYQYSVCNCSLLERTGMPYNGKVVKLNNRRIALFDYCGGYLILIKRLADKEEIASGEPRVKETYLPLSREAFDSLFMLMAERVGISIPKPKKQPKNN